MLCASFHFIAYRPSFLNGLSGNNVVLSLGSATVSVAAVGVSPIAPCP